MDAVKKRLRDCALVIWSDILRFSKFNFEIAKTWITCCKYYIIYLSKPWFRLHIRNNMKLYLPYLLLLMVFIWRLFRGFGETEQNDMDALYDKGHTKQKEFQDVIIITL